MLAQHVNRPLTLVSAPAGYGKSSLVSSWLESCDIPYAWISLDESESDLHPFMIYFLAAVEKLFPDACENTHVLVNAAEIPPETILSASLVNDLDQIDKPFIIVLDDFHLIGDAPAVKLLADLLQHPPRPMHLVVITRKDPLLPLSQLRVKNQINEIRTRNLRFSAAETTRFLDLALASSVDATVSKNIGQITEGWITGLHLAVLSYRSHTRVDHLTVQLCNQTQFVTDYVVNEVLQSQPAEIQNFLLATAVLNRFCAPLCEAVLTACGEGQPMTTDGQAFLDYVEKANLFVIPLDEQRQWYRYHHLFQKILRQQLKRTWKKANVDKLQQTASRWFESQGLIEEAISHAEKSTSAKELGNLIARHRNSLLNREHWGRLTSWLKGLPLEIIDSDPDLQILNAWSLDNRLRLKEAFQAIDRTQALVEHSPGSQVASDQLSGGIHALRSRQHFESTNCRAAIHHAKEALTLLPSECRGERAFALGFQAVALLAIGRTSEAFDLINSHLSDDRLPRNIFRARLLAILSYLHWIEADMPALKLTAKEYIAIGDEMGLMESRAGGRYFLGIAAYQSNDLETAAAVLESMQKDRYLMASTAGFVQGTFALAEVYQALGRPDEAVATNQAVVEHMLRIRNLPLLTMARAHAADLALRNDNITEAVEWAKRYKPEPFSPMYRFYAPPLTLARVLLAERSIPSLERADQLLKQLAAYLTRTHNRRFLIETLAIQSMLSGYRDNQTAAVKLLQQAVSMATPGDTIRVFVDLGPACLKQLSRLDLEADALTFAGRILAAQQAGVPGASSSLPGNEPSRSILATPEMVEPLSAREREVISLLARRLSNSEIAEKLFIAPKTVKAHLYNIYQKFHVGNRRAAVTKARALGFIKDS